MNEKEFGHKHKLEQAMNDRDIMLAEANKEVQRLEALVAEAEKPKPLEHGDYGLDGGHRQYIVLKDEVYWLKSGEFSEIQPLNQFNGKIGNLADDLEAMSEPLEEAFIDQEAIGIRIKNGKVEIYASTCGECDKESGDWCGDHVEDFHRKLGQVIHKAKLDAAK